MSALVVDGHPDPDSLTAALARAYAAAHPDATLLAVRDLDVDLVLHRGLRADQPLEPDLLHAAGLLREADHVVLATPVWWESTPALLKGFLDRLLQAGWAYTYRGHRPVGLLAGRSARVLVTADSPGWYLRLRGSATVRQLRGGTLRFVGMKPVDVTRFTSVRTSDAARRAAWLEAVSDLARADAARVGRAVGSGRTRRDPGELTPRRREPAAG
ncbi:NAD(P)H-dependent oxidoreductase [Nocardioides zeae]|uniref:NAD(P)H-dependent oxidoreductase n=1 Tax=Nocardioides imazamoxiresistens TaxID=3231893 RepID=A0ABU3PVQ0_9ACTN|nr:NAD(P)H-dependent oxidoreductase [Nocardioides zeae]MDT9593320.1 NAD(P)H-dependent oxidoreductase [Nocardioides zeae]